MKLFLFALFGLFLFPLVSRAIDESTARRIAEDAAGCGAIKICETRARIKDDQWLLIVSTIFGRRENGEPIFKPGGWTAFTIEQDGTIVDTTPGR